MKALSLTQPMAWAIFHGKDIENRSRNTNFRGRCYIHASKTLNLEHYQWISDNENRLCCQLPHIADLAHGAIIGEVDIVSVVRNHGSLWFTGPYGLVLRNAKEYKVPIPCRGTIFPLFFEPKLRSS